MAVHDYLKTELAKKLATFRTDAGRYTFLCQQWNVWDQKRGRFIAASVLAGDLPAEFSFGPHGIITATDFLLVLGDIDAEKTKLERVKQ